MTRCKGDDGSRSLGTAELLETSAAILPQAAAALRGIADEFENVEMDDKSFEDFTAKCQNVIAREGGMHIAAVEPVTSENLDRLALRDGLGGAIRALSIHSVPTFIFSSGYGDLVTHALVQGAGVDASGAAAAGGGGLAATHGQLPQNIRIISNFFRTAPDGSVRAFSSPIVHERNKNATTAARLMGFALPERPHALILGSHEDDVQMADGASGVVEKLSIGFLELGEDLASRLPAFLEAYDAVVLGDGSFHFTKQLIEDILQVVVEPPKEAPRRGLGFFKGLDLGGHASDIF